MNSNENYKMNKQGRLTSLLGFNSIYLGMNYLWISFETLILPMGVEKSVPLSFSGLYLGIAAFIGGLSAIFGNLSSGIVGDKLKLRGGNRSIIVLFGSFMTMIGTFISIPLFGIYYGIIISFCILQYFSNVAIGSTQPLLSETVNKEMRGISSGINGLYTLIGSAIGFGLTSYFLTVFPFFISVTAIGLGVLITGIISFISGRHRKLVEISKHEHFHWKMIHDSNSKKLEILTIGSFFVFMGIMGLTYFEFYFFETILGVSNPEILIGIAGLLILFISSISSIVVGRLSDRVGRIRILIIGAAASSVPTFLIPFFSSFVIFLILGAFIGATYGSYYSVSIALAGDLANKSIAGTQLSMFNLSLSGASTLSPLIYGLILYLFRDYPPLSFHFLFTASSIFYIIGSITLMLFYGKRRQMNTL
ncbi:MFS transporter [Cuniculiplasma sp. SKW4]|uniref:MFS transporter n=1 Tax=Cuniculiplasma sp. SKW4 TaxID=3400171 RepID=UPI003FD4C405